MKNIKSLKPFNFNINQLMPDLWRSLRCDISLPRYRENCNSTLWHGAGDKDKSDIGGVAREIRTNLTLVGYSG